MAQKPMLQAEVYAHAMSKFAKQHMYFFFGASVTTVCLFFFVIGRVLTRLD